jgi:alpha-L-fucosidase 2
VRGLRARGNVTVNIDWDSCGAKQVVLNAGTDGPLTVRSALFDEPYDVRFDKSNKPRALKAAGQTFTFQARRGGTYTFSRGAAAACANLMAGKQDAAR